MKLLTGALLVLSTAGCTAKSDTPEDTDTDVSDTETANEPLLAVEDLVSFAPFGQRVELSWAEISEGESGYQVARSCSPEEGADLDGFCVLAKLEPDRDAYTDNTVFGGINYTYRVSAYAGEEQGSAETSVLTPPTIETTILPRPQGVWSLAEGEPSLPMPEAVQLDSNVAFETLRLLLRGSSPYSLPARLEAAGFEVSEEPMTGDPATGVMELFFHQTDGPQVPLLSDAVVSFEEMREEGFVIVVEAMGDGQRMTVSANTAAGLYRGGMASLGLFLDPDLEQPQASLEPMIVLDYPDHEVRSFYDYRNDGRLNEEKTGLEPEVEAFLDQMSRSGANLAFHVNYAHYAMLESQLGVSWEERLADAEFFRTATKDRFMELVAEIGETGPSSSWTPNGYPFVDGLAIHEEPFMLTEQSDGTTEAVPVSPPLQLISDWEMSDESAWTNPTTEECDNWSYDRDVGHLSPGSWRLDADGSGNCSSLRIPLNPKQIIDGRYLMAVRVKTDMDDDFLGPFGGSSGQITLTVRYDEGTAEESELTLNERSIAIGSATGTSKPTSANNDGSVEWFEFYTTVVLDGQAQGKTITSAEVWSRSMSGKGTYWMDELSFERINGSLKNVVGGVQAPLVTSSDRLTVYEEGVDYTVCQVGEDGNSGVYMEICSDVPDQANYLTTYYKRSHAGTLRYGFDPRYSRDLAPFEIRWLDEHTLPADGELLISYDINLPYQGQFSTRNSGLDYISQRFNFCEFDTVFEGTSWGDAYDRVLGEGAGQMGATHIRLGLSEARGLNRSRLCDDRFEEDGVVTWKKRFSNATLFSGVANRLIEETFVRNPDATVYFWDDMLSPFFNGGQDLYQARYGGPPGATGCALAPEALPSLCSDVDDVVPVDPRAIMIHWSYRTEAIRQTQATARFYTETNRPWLIGTGGTELVAEDWAAIAKSSDTNVGVSAFYFSNGDISHSLRTFWNYDWRLRFLLDFETAESSKYQFSTPNWSVTDGEAFADSTGTCANYGSQNSNGWPGNNDGGLCITSTEGGVSVALDEVAASSLSAYRAGVFLKGAEETESTHPTVRFVWTLDDGSTISSEWVPTQVVEVLDRPDNFTRYETNPSGEVAPANSVGVSLELQISAGVSALDNILLWESTPSCFDACE